MRKNLKLVLKVWDFFSLFIAGGEPANFKISGSYVQAVCPRVRQSWRTILSLWLQHILFGLHFQVFMMTRCLTISFGRFHLQNITDLHSKHSFTYSFVYPRTDFERLLLPSLKLYQNLWRFLKEEEVGRAILAQTRTQGRDWLWGSIPASLLQ